MIDFEDDDISFNPTLSGIIKLVGSEAAAQLSKDFCGARLYIPKSPGQHSPLAVSIGLDAAQKIAHTYGGMYFTVPVNIGKEAEIKELLSSGEYSASQIARKVRCSLSTVRNVSSRLTEEKQQKLPF